MYKIKVEVTASTIKELIETLEQTGDIVEDGNWSYEHTYADVDGSTIKFELYRSEEKKVPPAGIEPTTSTP